MAVPFIRKYLAFGLVGGFTYVALHFTIYLINPERIIDPFLKLIPIIPVILSMLPGVSRLLSENGVGGSLFGVGCRLQFIRERGVVARAAEAMSTGRTKRGKQRRSRTRNRHCIPI